MLRYIEKPEGGVRVETDYGLDLKGAALPENESVIAATIAAADKVFARLAKA